MILILVWYNSETAASLLDLYILDDSTIAAVHIQSVSLSNDQWIDRKNDIYEPIALVKGHFECPMTPNNISPNHNLIAVVFMQIDEF